MTVIFLASFLYGVAAGRYRIFPFQILDYLYHRAVKKIIVKAPRETGRKRQGLWRKARAGGSPGVDDEKLSSLPYLQGYKQAPGESGVTFYQKGPAYEGLNFWVSGHKPAAYLMDMNGKVLHEWSIEYGQVWPEGEEVEAPEVHKTFWRRAYLYDNGDLLAIFEGIGIIRLDKDSNLIWANKCNAHHDIFVADNGDIYTLTRKLIKSHPYLALERPAFEDYVTILGPDGKIKKQVSVLDALVKSKYASLLVYPRPVGDLLHTNTIQLLREVPAGHPIFKKGMVLLSFRTISAIAVMDVGSATIPWAMTGMWRYQHDPELLPDGNLLIFDNEGNYGKSKVIEFNPLTDEISWRFYGTEGKRLFSRFNGAVQRLPNGNTLITESDYGRAVEVTRGRKIVWEFLNPHRAGENNELIATLFDMVRLPPGKIDCTADEKDGCFR